MGIPGDVALIVAASAPVATLVIAEMARREAAKAARHAERVDWAVNGRLPGAPTISDDVAAMRVDHDRDAPPLDLFPGAPPVEPPGPAS